MAKTTSSANVAVAYIRVSTEEQVQEGVSLAAQEARLRAYCAMRGLELADVIVDAGVSGGKPLHTREGGARLLSAVRARRVSHVIAYKLDRLFRDCADCLDVTRAWDKADVSLHLVDLGGQAVDTSSAMGRFFLTVMAGAAELERNQIRERTSAAMAHKRARGEYNGGEKRYGYRLAGDGVTLEPIAEEQAVLEAARELRAAGRSLRDVAAELAARGFTSRTGGQFSAEQVKRMCA